MMGAKTCLCSIVLAATVLSAKSLSAAVFPIDFQRSRVNPIKQQPSPISSPIVPHVWGELLAGGVSRSLSQVVLYPIDALRTLAQTRGGRTLTDVGLSSLVRGCTTTSAFALVMGSIQFAVFGLCRDQIGPLLASAAGAVSSCVVSVPQEVIKQRLVTGIYPTFRNAVKSIYSTEGVTGFYNSWRPTMARNVPFVMITFLTMDALKARHLRREGASSELSLRQNLMDGFTSSLIAVMITTPADVVKTRMMTQAASSQIPYGSAMDCLTSIITKEGPLTLYAGVRQRALYVCTLWSLTFALNGRIKKYLLDRQTVAR